MNRTAYAFNGDTRQVVALNLTNGTTSFVSNVDPAAGLVVAADCTNSSRCGNIDK